MLLKKHKVVGMVNEKMNASNISSIVEDTQKLPINSVVLQTQLSDVVEEESEELETSTVTEIYGENTKFTLEPVVLELEEENKKIDEPLFNDTRNETKEDENKDENNTKINGEYQSDEDDNEKEDQSNEIRVEEGTSFTFKCGNISDF